MSTSTEGWLHHGATPFAFSSETYLDRNCVRSAQVAAGLDRVDVGFEQHEVVAVTSRAAVSGFQ